MCALLTGVQTCALPIYPASVAAVMISNRGLIKFKRMSFSYTVIDPATFRFVVNSEGLLQMYSHLCARLYIHSGEGLAVKFIHPLRHVSHATEIGRAHVCTPVTNAHLVCRLLLEKKKTTNTRKDYTT